MRPVRYDVVTPARKQRNATTAALVCCSLGILTACDQGTSPGAAPYARAARHGCQADRQGRSSRPTISPAASTRSIPSRCGRASAATSSRSTSRTARSSRKAICCSSSTARPYQGDPVDRPMPRWSRREARFDFARAASSTAPSVWSAAGNVAGALARRAPPAIPSRRRPTSNGAQGALARRRGSTWNSPRSRRRSPAASAASWSPRATSSAAERARC